MSTNIDLMNLYRTGIELIDSILINFLFMVYTNTFNIFVSAVISPEKLLTIIISTP